MAGIPQMPLLAALLLVLAPAAQAGDVYKCVDADGKTQYSSRPCPKDAEGEKLAVQRPATPEEDGEAPPRKSLDERIAEATDPVVKARLEITKQECELAATQLKRYEDAPYLVQKQADGSERKLTPEEAEAEKDKIRRAMKERC